MFTILFNKKEFDIQYSFIRDESRDNYRKLVRDYL